MFARRLLAVAGGLVIGIGGGIALRGMVMAFLSVERTSGSSYVFVFGSTVAGLGLGLLVAALIRD